MAGREGMCTHVGGRVRQGRGRVKRVAEALERPITGKCGRT